MGLAIWALLPALASYAAALTVSKENASFPVTIEQPAVDKLHNSSGGRVLVVVLGHGQASRSAGLSSTLRSFRRQLGPENFDCLVYVWNMWMPLPDLPPGCEVKVTPGVFMEYTKLIPEERLQAAKYTYLMADDVTLNVPGFPPMDISQLRDMATANCLDVLTPAQFRANYDEMKPTSDTAAAPGHLVRFFEWQGNLVRPHIVHALARLAGSNITGCWSYDSLLWDAVEKWTGRTPRLGIADKMVVDIGEYSLSGKSAAESEHDLTKHPCGKIHVENGKIYHYAAHDQVDYWSQLEGFTDRRPQRHKKIGQLVNIGSPKAISPKSCASMLSPGVL
mmetsp:Transcript_31317/g.57404  ORF Transcript_31317/g.57404 Transcript_31317/m.57404 type:complete len:335 (-) Transcript_31317:72-1076(-)